jgi:tetratricopeptide (TPR) repeat protein
VALDADGVEAAGPWIDRAKTTHPALIDQTHQLDELLGVVNVPSGIWIDEDGMIVRPPEPAFPWRPRQPTDELLAKLPAITAEQLREAQKIRIEPDRYLGALRDWVARGPESPHALSADEVISRSRHRSADLAYAAASFELAEHLRRAGREPDAIQWFREAHRLDPENWTYKRQAWSLVDPLQGPTAEYDSDWLTEVRKIGPENYYPPLEL